MVDVRIILAALWIDGRDILFLERGTDIDRDVEEKLQHDQTT